MADDGSFEHGWIAAVGPTAGHEAVLFVAGRLRTPVQAPVVTFATHKDVRVAHLTPEQVETLIGSLQRWLAAVVPGGRPLPTGYDLGGEPCPPSPAAPPVATLKIHVDFAPLEQALIRVATALAEQFGREVVVSGEGVEEAPQEGAPPA
jgi:hypothetical protein